MADINKYLESILGSSYEDIIDRAQRGEYATLPQGSRHHAEGAEQAARRFGFIPSQILGLGVEAVEALQTGRNTNLRDTATDLAANVVGGARGAYPFLKSISLPRKQKGGKVPKIRVPAKDLVKRYQLGGAVNPRQFPTSGGIDPNGSPVPGFPAPQTKAPKGQKPAGGAPAPGGFNPTPSQQQRFNLPGQQQAPGAVPTGANAQNVVGQTLGAIQNINPDLSGINRVSGQLEGFNPNYRPDTGAMMGTANQLSNFNPIQGQASNTLQNIIATGNAVDTAPITQAAQIRAQQGFQDFMGQANEGFGAMGLGSSSARTASLGREAGRLQQGIAATGMEAEVGAQEAARQRQLQGFNPLLAGSGQQLQGLGMAGGLQGQAAGLGLEGQIAGGQQRLGALSAAGGLQGQAAGLGLQGQLGKAGEFNQLSGNLIPQAVGVNQRPQPQPYGSTSGFGSHIRPGGVAGKQKGGRVDLGDYLGNLTFGQTFTRPPAQDYDYGARRSSAAPASDPIRDAMMREQLHRMQAPTPSDRRERLSESYKAQALAEGLLKGPRAYRQAGDVESLSGIINAIGIPAAHAGLMQSGRLLAGQSGSPLGLGGLRARGYSGLAGAFGRSYRPEEKMHGGVVDGPAVPPDQVPIMAQGGEGVIPVHLMHQLENAKRPKQLAAIARRIQQLMGKEPQMNHGDMQRKQRGGKIAKVMHEFKAGSLRSGGPNGPVVKDRKQAIAIALSEAREAGQQAAPRKMQAGGLLDAPRRTQLAGTDITFDPSARSFTNIPDQDFVGPIPQQEGRAGLSIMGREESEDELAQRRYEEARGRASLLRTLALQSPRGALEKMAPLIGQAEQEEAAMLENLNLIQGRQAEIGQQEAQRQFLGKQNELQRGSAEEVARLGIERERQKGVEAAKAKSIFGGIDPNEVGIAPESQPTVEQGAAFGAAAGLAGAPPPPPDPLSNLLDSGDPNAVEEALGSIDPAMIQVSPEAKLKIRELLKQMLIGGMSEEEMMTRYGALYTLGA